MRVLRAQGAGSAAGGDSVGSAGSVGLADASPGWRNVPRARLASVAVVALAACGLVAGCTAGGGNNGGDHATNSANQVTLSFLTFETPNLTSSYWDNAIKQASAKVPDVKIKKLVAPTADYAGYARQLLASGQLPDLMIGIQPADFVKAHALAPFKFADLKRFQYPTAGQINGEVYQLPWATQGVPLVYYNKADFAKAGILQPPKTWSEFLAACAKLKAVGITPVEIGGGGADTWVAQYPLIAAVTADVYQKDPHFAAQLKSGEASFTDPRFVAAVKKVELLANMNYLDKAGISRSYANTEQAFRDNKAAMYPMGSWFSASADAKPTNFGLGVFTWPTNNGSMIFPAYTGGGITVSSKAPDVALAQQWAVAFSTNTANLDAEVKADGEFMAIKGYVPPNTVGNNYKAGYRLFREAVDVNSVRDAFSTESGSDALPGGTVTDMQKGIVDVIDGTKSAAQFAAYLQHSYQQNGG